MKALASRLGWEWIKRSLGAEANSAPPPVRRSWARRSSLSEERAKWTRLKDVMPTVGGDPFGLDMIPEADMSDVEDEENGLAGNFRFPRLEHLASVPQPKSFDTVPDRANSSPLCKVKQSMVSVSS